ncbi:hypothetical protein G6011_00725 [Alternaria panax]|uniref:Uncharacterized protein n=1 Tax=Alternaria panax TaxID=48097 RepID=A0AAD4IJS8_9PLEO|nr:hypothetical protein G6011_00725 [Alternaria panax]
MWQEHDRILICNWEIAHDLYSHVKAVDQRINQYLQYANDRKQRASIQARRNSLHTYVNLAQRTCDLYEWARNDEGRASRPEHPWDTEPAAQSNSRSSQEASHSPVETPHSSHRTSHTSAVTPKPLFYDSRLSAQAVRTSDQPPYSTASASPHTSDFARNSTVLTHRSSAQSRNPTTQTPRSSASAPYSTTRHPLSPPPTTPHDDIAWVRHDDLLHSLTVRASDLDQLALAAEARWKAAEGSLPPSEHHTIGRAANIPTLRDIHLLLARIDLLVIEERNWRDECMPRSPREKYPAWRSVYSQVMGVGVGEGLRPSDVVKELDVRMEKLLERGKKL